LYDAKAKISRINRNKGLKYHQKGSKCCSNTLEYSQKPNKPLRASSLNLSSEEKFE